MASYSSPKMKSFASKTAGVTPPHAALDYGDTFLDVIHLRESFAGCELTVDGIEVTNDYDAEGNDIRFTPVQVSAIRSGLSPGLTTIIGPPGTGKTDVAVQIIGNLYHSFPTQRTVIVTHSNAALNGESNSTNQSHLLVYPARLLTPTYVSRYIRQSHGPW